MHARTRVDASRAPPWTMWTGTGAGSQSTSTGTSVPSAKSAATMYESSRVTPWPARAAAIATSGRLVVKRGATGNLHGIRTVPERPVATRAQAGERHDLVRREIGGRGRRAARREVAGRRTDHAPHGAHPDRREGGVGQVADAHRDVHALLEQVDDPIDEEGA